ncbi:Hh protein intein-like-domain-containing protein [Microdochium trichocladiopsis]|uniref:Hh protein intein-like-domain-containing protein n=1 Tax=Microdochium trichocladiopsis TaxID=1682393 RepID=A0A9P9BF01_9PEZI|nr:Hh protein intein-like-domain-containing protein [Microdochium trichocladiopsis]KAH7009358.1 Hh protein intein-like-domain-containing protein [Microdochium trichocladiopsis]
MIGTVFIHAVAHLQTTYATRCTLEITTPLSARLRTTQATVINGTITTEASAYNTPTHNVLKLDLGNLQYGQSRDIYLEYYSHTGSPLTLGQVVAGEKKANRNFDPKTAVLSTRLEYLFMKNKLRTVAAEKSLVRRLPPAQEKQDAGEGMSAAMAAYHVSRAQVSAFLASFFRPHPHSGYTLAFQSRDLSQRRDELTKLIKNLPARQYLSPPSPHSSTTTTRLHQSLLADAESQITIALSSEQYFSTWSMPYFASLSHAHSRQQCISFKDPGLQGYNDNPFFRRCRDELDTVFERIEPPAPSLAAPPRYTLGGSSTQYNHSQNNDAGRGHGSYGRHGTRAAIASGFSRPAHMIAAYFTGSHAAPSTSSGMQTPPPAYARFESSRPNMEAYNNVDATCFAGSTLVGIAAAGGSDYHSERAVELPISKIRPGMAVVTPLGPRQVWWVLQTAVQDAALYRISGGREGGGFGGGKEGFLVTAWHPICIDLSPSAASPSTSGGSNGSENAANWTSPAQISSKDDIVTYTGYVYSLMLEPDADPMAHAILVSGQKVPVTRSSRQSAAQGANGVYTDSITRVWGVILCHGLTPSTRNSKHENNHADGSSDAQQHDARTHAFFGDYKIVEKALRSLEAAERATSSSSDLGVVSSAGLVRDEHTGLVRGFQPL